MVRPGPESAGRRHDRGREAAGRGAGAPTGPGPPRPSRRGDNPITDPLVPPVDTMTVNVPPRFTAGPDQRVREDAGARTVAGWATGISPGPPSESGQSVTFRVTSD